MAHSLEVRVPLVDATLLSQVAPVMANSFAPSKRLLVNAPRLSLPPKVIGRPKTGFATPIQSWLQSDKRVQQWRRVPALTVDRCPWARRWAYQVAAA
jgi:asparagine synthase (glutamine-hydrolysing)